MMVPVVYHPNYNIPTLGLQRLHPFDCQKYRRIYKWLIRQGLRQPQDFVGPPAVSPADLGEIHSNDYLNSLRKSSELARILEVPFLRHFPAWLLRWAIQRPMRLATGGTILASQLAWKHGLAINLGGGFHHASFDRAQGFCLYADVPLALLSLRKNNPTLRVLVIDTDAHQGDGTAFFRTTFPNFFILDFFEEDIFPWPKQEVDFAVPLPARTNGAEYMELLHRFLPEVMDRFSPEFVFYNAGSDVLWSDPFTSLFLTEDEIAERDLTVVTQVRERDIPLAMVLSGGYGAGSWHAHAVAVEGILARFDRS
jgi:histone deacetylase 11